MSDFETALNEYYGDATSTDDIRVVCRPCFFFDFDGHPLHVWRGQGLLTTSDGNEWYGSIAGDGNDCLTTPAIQDGRDGTSATYDFSLEIPEIPGEDTRALYQSLKEDQWRVNGRSIWCYHALFLVDEGLRPVTPIRAFRELTMFSTKFSESVESPNGKALKLRYKITVSTKDANFGRSKKPGGTYTDTMQKRRAAEQGYSNDRGCEFIAALANRTYTLP